MAAAPNVAVLDAERLQIQLPPNAPLFPHSRLLDRDVNSGGNMRFILRHYFLQAGSLPPWNAGAQPLVIANEVWNGYQAPNPAEPHQFARTYIGGAQ